MAQTKNFNETAENRKEEMNMDKMRELCGQLSDLEKANPDYDPFEKMDETIRKIDPEKASLMNEEAARYAQEVADKLSKKKA